MHISPPWSGFPWSSSSHDLAQLNGNHKNLWWLWIKMCTFVLAFFF
jgi:hypothetical protein